MKRIYLLMLLMLAASTFLNAQFSKGSKELSLSGSIGSYTYSQKSPGGTTSSKDYQYFTVYLSPGYYIVDGLSFEPEVAFYFSKDNTPAQYYLANISYTAKIGEGKTGLFFRAGYGVGNSMIFPGNNDVPLPMTKSLDVKIINAGAGLKLLINANVLARLELNYRVQSYSRESSYYSPWGSSSWSYDYTYSNISLIFGFAFLIP
ncbi:MAG: hypothetical protein HUU43_08230 [Ignavibacteriaceae bacterium]|nr:hypothetical protein [Ignavibacteriaceae bacterium]